MSPTEKRTTHFGYQEVPVDESLSRGRCIPLSGRPL